MEGEKSSLDKIKIFRGSMFAFTGIFVFFFSFITGKNYEMLLRNTITAFIIAGAVCFMLKDADDRGKEALSFDNFYHPERFFITYMVMVVLSGIFSLVPGNFWPYMSVFVIFALFSNTETGIFTGLGFTALSVMLQENGSIGRFLMYVIAGIVAVALFRSLNEQTNIGFPLFIALIIQAVLLMAFDVLFINRTLTFSILLLPFFNLMLNLIIMLLFLNMFGVYIIRRSNDMYMEINDVEYPLLAQLRQKDREEYFRAVHTGYLAERLSHGLSYNERAAKTCAYYHRIGILEGKNTWADVEHYFLENNFPPDAVELLHEYMEPQKGKIRSKEALTVQLSETVIASIMYLIKKNKDAKIDYDKLIDDLFDKKLSEKSLKDYDVTFADYDRMRQILKKEKLYYDFLR